MLNEVLVVIVICLYGNSVEQRPGGIRSVPLPDEARWILMDGDKCRIDW